MIRTLHFASEGTLRTDLNPTDFPKTLQDPDSLLWVDFQETYLAVINNRMNEIMKTLTIITSLFMPLSFMTGFFGMNFFQPVAPLHAWTDRAAFLVTLALTLLVPFTMYQWMRRRGWR